MEVLVHEQRHIEGEGKKYVPIGFLDIILTRVGLDAEAIVKLGFYCHCCGWSAIYWWCLKR